MSTTKLKPGQIVTVYQKPLTREGLEGQAKLIRFSGEFEQVSVLPIETESGLHYPNGFEYWYVRFINEKGEYLRLIEIV
jgi:hypothetical protein